MLDRPDALRLIDAAFPDQPLVLTLGGTIREMLAVVGPKANHLYCLDAMGQPLAIGLGLALGLAGHGHGERVVVVEGDGSLLMGFSALATVGHLRPRNLVLLVLDNGVYLATGGQPTAARAIDFASVARACGWANALDVESTPDALRNSLKWAAEQDGPLLLRVPVSTIQPKTDFFLEDPVLLARSFEDWLRGP
ncbi:MAG: thiamine pyrophosphate-dependent enzyme [Chloroflexota bacterium]|nr:thiamine pyrophosphate-dependent enzyme [Chloroflexota bacterium]